MSTGRIIFFSSQAHITHAKPCPTQASSSSISSFTQSLTQT
ncbi:hypothetical protein MtrunA17_Chr6g0484321 [Medicago truncatula]|uniref:Uncharacterized protein n=1 Tax=Medicago truncatula TaxID=3880 RepID=A0A396HHH4_MEDTR|nr:hypothetical protein MtrunA17_Chr6g0484321 [Medicago truncatula]